MRHLGILFFFVAVVSLTVKVTEKICSPETDKEFCDSVGIECGVDIRTADSCGEIRYIECRCASGTSCDERTLRCTNVVNRLSPLLTGDRYIVVCDHSSLPTKLRLWSQCPPSASRRNTTRVDPSNNMTNILGNRSE